MNIKFAFVFLLGLSSTFAAPGVQDSGNESQGNNPVDGRPPLSEGGNPLGGGVGGGIALGVGVGGGSQNNNPGGGRPLWGEGGNVLGGGVGGGSEDNSPLSKIPIIGGLANAFQEGMKGGQQVLKKGLDTGKTALETGLKVATGIVPFKLPF